MHRRTFLLTAGAASMSARLSFAQARDKDLPDTMTFGNLRGRFVYDGQPPERKPIRVFRDADALGVAVVPDETLIVHPTDKGVANVLIWLETPKGDDAHPLTIHKSYEKLEEADAVLEYHGGRLLTRMLAMRTTQTFRVINSDPVAHNCKTDCIVNPQSNPLLIGGGTMERAFEKSEPLPFRVGCHIHPWEHAHVFVCDHPYFAVTAPDGAFEIRNIPVGKWSFGLWHEKPRLLQGGKVAGKDLEWPKGRYAIDIRSGTTDLGEIKLSPEIFAK